MSDITFDQKGCARCDADEHPGMVFVAFTYPIEINDKAFFTHWALCPNSGEPILLHIGDKA